MSGNPASGPVPFNPKVPVSCLKVKIPHYVRRSFEVDIADEPWKSGDVVLPATFGKEEIWKHLQSLTPLPHHSQFQIISGRNEISHLPNGPIGLIALIPKKFPVTWRIEWPRDPTGFVEEVQQDMTPLVDAEEAWGILHTQVSGLFERATSNYRAKLRPGQVITAEVVREVVSLSIRFGVKDRGYITFTHQTISTVSPRSEIHAHFAKVDTRIPPFACYEHDERRPCFPETVITYRLGKDIEIPDLSSNEGGTAGGGTSRGLVLPPIIYPTAPTETR
jgi:hypothetical protein